MPAATTTTPRQRQILERLKEVSIFARLEEESLSHLATLFTEQSHNDNSVVFAMGDPGDALYIVAQGEVKVSLAGDSGREMILSTLGEGSFFGEMSLIDGEPRSAHVVCTEDAVLLRLGRREFREALRNYPSIAINIMTELCERLRRADEAIGSLALLDVYGRVARFLLDKADAEGEDVEGGRLLENMPTQQYIASSIGTSRETVSRALSEFQRRGLIEQRSGRGMIVRDSLTVEAVSRSR